MKSQRFCHYYSKGQMFTSFFIYITLPRSLVDTTEERSLDPHWLFVGQDDMSPEEFCSPGEFLRSEIGDANALTLGASREKGQFAEKLSIWLLIR